MDKAKGKSGPLAQRPDNSAFKQQRLPAWSPMLTASTVLPCFYFIASLCLLLGVWLLLTVQSTKEMKVSENCSWFFCSFYFLPLDIKYTEYMWDWMPMCAIKKGVTGKMKGYDLSWVNRKQFIHYSLCIFLLCLFRWTTQRPEHVIYVLKSLKMWSTQLNFAPARWCLTLRKHSRWDGQRL